MIVGPIAAVLIFIAGQAWNRYDGDRRERRASRAARLVAFEQLQRETHLELQEALGDMYKAAADRAVDNAAGVETAADRIGTILITAHRVERLESRLADAEARALVSRASGLIQELADASTGAEILKASDVAEEAVDKAIRKLGEFVREPPSA